MYRTEWSAHGMNIDIDQYVRYVVASDERSAFSLIENLLTDGCTVAGVYLSLIAPAQRELGARWSTGELSIANEHLASEITLRMMDRLRERARRGIPHGKRAIVSAAPKERHALAARIVSDFLYIDGWSVDYLGADMPGEELAAFTGRTNPDLVAISAVFGTDLNPLQEAIRDLRVAAPGAKVLVGGAAIANDEHAKSLGADGFAQDAAGAALVARHLVGLKIGETLGELLGRIGENLQSLRRSRNWNQQQMATAAGVDRTYLSGVENGKQNLSLAALQKLAGALDLPAVELLK